MAAKEPIKNMLHEFGLSVPKVMIKNNIGKSRKCVNVGTLSACAFCNSGVNAPTIKAACVKQRKRKK